MTILAPIMLAVVMIMSDGSTYQRNIEYKTIDLCWQAAYRFLQASPSDYGATALGAGCVVYPGLRPS